MHVGSVIRRIPILAIVALACGVGVWGQDLKASIAQIPGLADSPESGTFVEMVKELDRFYTAGKITIQVVPMARSIQDLMTGVVDFHVPTFTNPAIPPAKIPFGWLDERTGPVMLLIYSHKDKPLTRAMIDQANARGGTFPYVVEVGGGMESLFDFPVVGSNDAEASMRKVNAGRIDAYVWPPEGDLTVRALKLGNIHREILSTFDDVIMVAKTPRGEQVKRLLAGAMAAFRSSGRLYELHSKVHYPYTDWQPHNTQL